MSTGTQELESVAAQAVLQCRLGNWEEGLSQLLHLANDKRNGEELPGVFYSFLGYAVARVHGDFEEGLALCRHAVRVQFFEPENYANLARVHLLRRDRKAAVRQLERGLELDPQHGSLRRLASRMGYRSRPVIPFLRRSNGLNRFLGRLRYRFRQRSDD